MVVDLGDCGALEGFGQPFARDSPAQIALDLCRQGIQERETLTQVADAVAERNEAIRQGLDAGDFDPEEVKKVVTADREAIVETFRSPSQAEQSPTQVSPATAPAGSSEITGVIPLVVVGLILAGGKL